MRSGQTASGESLICARAKRDARAVSRRCCRLPTIWPPTRGSRAGQCPSPDGRQVDPATACAAAFVNSSGGAEPVFWRPLAAYAERVGPLLPTSLLTWLNIRCGDDRAAQGRCLDGGSPPRRSLGWPSDRNPASGENQGGLRPSDDVVASVYRCKFAAGLGSRGNSRRRSPPRRGSSVRLAGT